MKLNLTADEVLTSTRAVRKRLDFEEPVPMEVITECLEQAVQAPTGSTLEEKAAAWTTIHLMYEKEAAEILGIPFDEYSQCSLITVGYSIGTEFKKAKRPPVQTIMHVDSWGAHPEIPA